MNHAIFRYLFILLAAGLCGPAVFAQEAAQMFAPGVVSTGVVYGTTFAPDGKTLYFTRTFFENGKRTKPENIFFIELAKLPAFQKGRGRKDEG